MIETIVSWVVSNVGELVEALVNWFMAALSLDLDTLTEWFPSLSTLYELLRAIGIGLVIAIAAISLAKYFAGSPDELKETPMSILAHAFIAIALIYVGGWAVEWIFNVTKDPFNAIMDQESVIRALEGDNINLYSVIGWSGLAVAFPNIAGLSATVSLLLSFVVLCMIIKNLWQVMLEVAQRYMYLAILVYSAPLVFSTVASKNTSDIFKKWVNMFISQCLLMVLSAWSLKIILSGFSYVDGFGIGKYLIKMVLVCALCSVCCKLDTYLQRLGLNTVSTGMGLADVVANSVPHFGGSGSHSNGSKSAILGALSPGNIASGVVSGLTDMAKGFAGAAVNTAKADANRVGSGQPFKSAGAHIADAHRGAKGVVTNAAKSAKQAFDSQAKRLGITPEKTGGRDAGGRNAGGRNAGGRNAGGRNAGGRDADGRDADGSSILGDNGGLNAAGDGNENHTALNDEAKGAGLGIYDSDNNPVDIGTGYTSADGVNSDGDGVDSHGDYVDGPSSAVSEFMNQNGANYENLSPAQQDLVSGTIEHADPNTCATALTGGEKIKSGTKNGIGSNTTFGNDSANARMFEKAFGGAVDPNRQNADSPNGGFSNVNAANGVTTARYKSEDGQTMKATAMSESAYNANGRPKGYQQYQVPSENGNGSTFYMRSKPVTAGADSKGNSNNYRHTTPDGSTPRSGQSGSSSGSGRSGASQSNRSSSTGGGYSNNYRRTTPDGSTPRGGRSGSSSGSGRGGTSQSNRSSSTGGGYIPNPEVDEPPDLLDTRRGRKRRGGR